jgi:hypothetical protein
MKDKFQEYQERGYVIIDDFLPEKEANELNALYVSQKEWEIIDQVRERHYQHVFATKSEFLPKGDESYMARFGRSRQLEKSETVNQIYQDFFVPELNK